MEQPKIYKKKIEKIWVVVLKSRDHLPCGLCLPGIIFSLLLLMSLLCSYTLTRRPPPAPLHLQIGSQLYSRFLQSNPNLLCLGPFPPVLRFKLERQAHVSQTLWSHWVLWPPVQNVLTFSSTFCGVSSHAAFSEEPPCSLQLSALNSFVLCPLQCFGHASSLAPLPV